MTQLRKTAVFFVFYLLTSMFIIVAQANNKQQTAQRQLPITYPYTYPYDEEPCPRGNCDRSNENPKPEKPEKSENKKQREKNEN